jgi:hypothetical protein
VSILESLIAKEGIDPKYVDDYILSHETYREAMLRKSVARLQYNAKLSTFSIDSE